ncbi:PDZ domain containing protein [Aphelenchoides besseyi]|nr:PDZ domain containing protein [Aphelenchoides besseyi]
MTNLKENDKTAMITIEDMPAPSVMVETGNTQAKNSVQPVSKTPKNDFAAPSANQKSLAQSKSVMQGPSTMSAATSTMIAAPSTSQLNQESKQQPKPVRKRRRRKKDGQNTTISEETTITTDTRTQTEGSSRDSLEQELKRELASGPPFQKIKFEVDYEHGQYLGMKLSPEMVVLSLDPRSGTSPFSGKLLVGDMIRSVNTRKIKNLDAFYETLRNSKNSLLVSIDRPIRIKPGDFYFTAYLFYRPQVKLGFAVKAHADTVMLIKVDEEGLGAGVLEVGDTILDVDGVPVKTTQEAKSYILQSLQKRGFVSTVIMHPMNERSLETVRSVLGFESDCDPDMRMDAILIGRHESMRRKMEKTRQFPKKGIFVKQSSNRNRVRRISSIDINKNKEIEIWSDVDAEDWAELEPMEVKTTYPTLSRMFNRNHLDENSGQRIRDLCNDVLQQAQLFADSVDEVQFADNSLFEEHWQSYRKRLQTYHLEISYPETVNPVKCALAGWIYVDNGTLRCDDCRAQISISPPSDSELDPDQLKRFGHDVLSSLHTSHEKLCPWRVGRSYELPSYTVEQQRDSIRTMFPDSRVECGEITDEFSNYAHILKVQPDFSLYFAVAGWIARENKLHCDFCLKTLFPKTETLALNPLRLHQRYCPVLEHYPPWKLAVEEYVNANSNPISISENFALIQKQLAATDLLNESAVLEDQSNENDVSMNDKYSENQTGEAGIHEAAAQDHFESSTIAPQALRDDDFEAEVQEHSRKRLLQRGDNIAEDEMETEVKRSRTDFSVDENAQNLFMNTLQQLRKEAVISSQEPSNSMVVEPQAHANMTNESFYSASSFVEEPAGQLANQNSVHVDQQQEDQIVPADESPELGANEQQDEGIDESDIDEGQGSETDDAPMSNQPADESVEILFANEPQPEDIVDSASDPGVEDEVDDDDLEEPEDYAEELENYDEEEQYSELESEEGVEESNDQAAVDGSDSDSDIIVLSD